MRNRAFTLVELMVVIVIIGIVAAMSLAALQKARTFAAEQKTKATIAKLDSIITRRIEAYKTRRLPMTLPQEMNPKDASILKLDYLRELMRLEMPDCAWDVTENAKCLKLLSAATGNLESQINSLQQQYRMKGVWIDPNGLQSYDPAQCLYLIVASNAQDMEQFSQNEIGTVGPRGNRVFIDGWGKPIMWLRWAPGYLPQNGANTFQTGNANDDHDPFDSRKVDSVAYNLTPLIYSAGPDKEYGLYLGDVKNGFVFPDPKTWGGHIRPCTPVGTIPLLGTPDPFSSKKNHYDNITNHSIEMQ